MRRIHEDALHERPKLKIRAQGGEAKIGVPAAVMRIPSTLKGTWRIVETDLWDEDTLDLSGPAHIALDADGGGSLAMIAIQADVDCRRDGKRVEFSWMGDDDGTPTGGRGWAKLTRTGALEGRIFIHRGDEASFRARRTE